VCALLTALTHKGVVVQGVEVTEDSLKLNCQWLGFGFMQACLGTLWMPFVLCFLLENLLFDLQPCSNSRLGQ
jgi:hypothetical protein